MHVKLMKHSNLKAFNIESTFRLKFSVLTQDSDMELPVIRLEIFHLMQSILQVGDRSVIRRKKCKKK